jgi:hypothetical protein
MNEPLASFLGDDVVVAAAGIIQVHHTTLSF